MTDLCISSAYFATHLKTIENKDGMPYNKLGQQKVVVDSVSGAASSSQVIKKVADNALRQTNAV